MRAMDIANVVYAAVDAVARRIASIGTAGALALTDSVADRLYGAVAERLSGSAIGAHLLRGLETAPADTAAQWAIAQALAAEAEADGQFAEELRHLVGQLTASAPQHGAFGLASTTVGGQGFPRPGPIPPQGAAVGPDQISKPRQTFKPTTGGVIVIIAVAVIMMLISMTVLAKVVLPQAGITESARLNRLEGIWTTQTSNGSAMLIVRSDHTVALSGGSPSCPGRVTSPARSNYVFEVDCGLVKTTFEAKLNLRGNELTLTSPGGVDKVVMHRE
ncbi:hypothetical protein ABZ671_11750 [Micromonospora sp. NPDC006766]|uniref:hypothetical protein n=1 Tax=Micromonospora sp. NPDC006766 TaxID=3154778 RepID=UPI00340B2D58